MGINYDDTEPFSCNSLRSKPLVGWFDRLGYLTFHEHARISNQMGSSGKENFCHAMLTPQGLNHVGEWSFEPPGAYSGGAYDGWLGPVLGNLLVKAGQGTPVTITGIQPLGNRAIVNFTWQVQLTEIGKQSMSSIPELSAGTLRTGYMELALYDDGWRIASNNFVPR